MKCKHCGEEIQCLKFEDKWRHVHSVTNSGILYRDRCLADTVAEPDTTDGEYVIGIDTAEKWEPCSYADAITDPNAQYQNIDRDGDNWHYMNTYTGNHAPYRFRRKKPNRCDGCSDDSTDGCMAPVCHPEKPETFFIDRMLLKKKLFPWAYGPDYKDMYSLTSFICGEIERLARMEK